MSDAMPERAHSFLTVKALDDDGYTMCIDLTGVDYLEHMGRPLPTGITAERFEVVVNLLDLHARRRVRLRVQVPESAATLPSLFDLYPGSEAMERETPDILGMSALLTTTMPYMKVVIDTMKEKGIRDDYIVLVGGAPLNEEFGRAIGADAYCRDAAVAVETAKAWVARKHNSGASAR